MKSWLLIDDSPEEAAAFASGLSNGSILSIEPISAESAANALGEGSFAPAGVLMDVDLSNEPGRRQSGPGMAQDMRVAQQKRSIPPFPIARFSMRNKVLENIGRDPSSDDIFDLKIDKDGLGEVQSRTAVRAKLIGAREIYDSLDDGGAALSSLLGLKNEIWARWGSSGIQSDFEVGNRVHLKAAPLIRMMTNPGLLIEENILAFRLGVDRNASKGWPRFLENISDCVYRGVASGNFPRWWARGLEDWWQDRIEANTPLGGNNISQRIEHLSKCFEGLVALTMPKGSMGDRPWRYCLLTKEQRQEIIPVDPSRAVKMKARTPMPSWLDPHYAAYGMARQNPTDPRLDRDDLKRLQLYDRKR